MFSPDAKSLSVAESLALIGHYRNALEQEGIACIIKNELLAGALGEVPFLECLPELWVLRDGDAARAERLIAELRLPAVTGPSWRCPQCGEDNDAGFGACWSCGAIAPDEPC